MKYFTGLDGSLEETVICIAGEAGAKEMRAASEPGALVEALQGAGLELERIGLLSLLADGVAARKADFGRSAAICIETRRAMRR